MAGKRSNRITRPTSTRHAGEIFKDLGTNTITGLIGGIVVAPFSSWSPSPFGWWMATLVFGLAFYALIVSQAQVVLARLQEEKVKSKLTAAVIFYGKLNTWFILIYFFLWVTLVLLAIYSASRPKNVPSVLLRPGPALPYPEAIRNVVHSV